MTAVKPPDGAPRHDRRLGVTRARRVPPAALTRQEHRCADRVQAQAEKTALAAYEDELAVEGDAAPAFAGVEVRRVRSGCLAPERPLLEQVHPTGLATLEDETGAAKRRRHHRADVVVVAVELPPVGWRPGVDRLCRQA